MNKSTKQVLAFPYIIWMVGFTVIPLLMVFYYGLTDRSGTFTFANVMAIMAEDHMKALLLSLAVLPLCQFLRRAQGAQGCMSSLDLLRCKLLFHSIPSGSADAVFWNIIAYFRRFSTGDSE